MSDHNPGSAAQDETRVEELLSRLTLEEKVSLLSGRDTWYTVPIPRLGIPSLGMTDGPHGVRADHATERVQGAATSFPTGVSMASSWDPGLIERVGAALAAETRALGCDILLGPCVNIVRTPLAGRNFETYAEDPYLAGRIGVAFVKGVQSAGVGTSLKHYACNNQEFERSRGDSQIDERTLREIYLPAFEAIVTEAKPWTVMCSYNRVNGVYASEHHHLLKEILKGEWGFDGFVVSDWGANHTVSESVAGGLDLEMPGPAKYYGRLLVEAVRNWQIEERDVDDAVRRILRIIARAGLLDASPVRPAGALNTPAHAALARELAEASMVLLKNEGPVLPLDLSSVRSLAVIGPNAAEARIGGGGSSYLEPPYRISPLEGLTAALGDAVEMRYEQGCDNYAELPVLRSVYLTPAEGTGDGLFGEYYDNAGWAGAPAATRIDKALDFWFLRPPAPVGAEAFSVRWTGALEVPVAGRYALKIVHTGLCRVRLDGKLLFENAPESGAPRSWITRTEPGYVELEAGHPYPIVVEYAKPPNVRHAALYLLGAYAPDPDDRLERAVAAARRSDVAIIFAGMPRGFESEGADRPHMALPGPQDELIRAVARANPRTIVVLNCGAPVEMPWIDAVPGLLLAYYPGQEGGNACARILTGEVNPSGKLSVTYPRRYEDNPTYTNYPGAREVRYGEGIYVGYRYYDHVDCEPLFPFGYGLSYTSFAYSDLRVPDQAVAGQAVEVTLSVQNVGACAGKEVIQLYVRDVEASLARPPKELKAFAKVALEPGERAEVRFALDDRAFSFYDPVRRAWVAEPGTFEILVGSSSRDIRARARMRLSG
ncbi:MAG: glycoside hydrolase family 3 C-terminal domain-containing protein [Anaerolineae bacterium]|nr:glycoside hydrolase family 3 C-terminal domain-containing protein [Anaerolineae bacterium]